VLRSIIAGARGFLTKSVSHAELVAAIRAGGQGKSLVDAGIAHKPALTSLRA
jgi:DNA-binding NarL/FixJ family response regulator